LHANAKRVVELYISIVRLRACCAPLVMLSARRQCDLFLGKTLDAVAHDIDTAFVGGVELEDSLFVRLAEQLAGQTENRRRLANTGHA
jgi:hypothetical protein